MQFFDSININTLIVAGVGIMLAIQQWKSGSSKIASDTLVAYQAKDTLNTETIRGLQDQVNTQAKEIGVLQGINQQKDQTLVEYKELIQGRNPAMEAILSKVATFMEQVDQRLQGIEAIHQGKTTVQVTHTPAA